MAITRTLITSNWSTVDGTSFATASITPQAGKLYLLATFGIPSGTPTTPTVTGAGLTWSPVDHTAFVSNVRYAVAYIAVPGAGATTGPITINTGATTNTGLAWFVFEIDGADLADPIAQSVNSRPTGITSVSVPFANPVDPANATQAITGCSVNQNINAGAGWTEGTQYLMTAPTAAVQTEFSNTALQNVTCSWAASANGFVVGVEIRAATAVNQTVTPGVASSAASALAPTVSSSLLVTPTLPVASVPQLFALTIQPGVATGVPNLVASAPTLFAPTTLTALTAFPGTASAPSIGYNPVITTALTATPAFLTGAPAAQAPVVSTTVTLLPSSAGSLAAANPPSIATSIAVTPDLVVSVPQTWSPDAQISYNATPVFLVSTPQTFAPAVTPGMATGIPNLLAVAPTLFVPTVRAVAVSTPNLLISAPVAFQPNLILTGSVLPDSIPFGGQVFAPVVVGGPTSLTTGPLSHATVLYAPTIKTTIKITQLATLVSAPAIFAPSLHALLHLFPDFLDGAPRLFSPHGPKQPAVWFFDPKTRQWAQAEVTFYDRSGRRWAQADVEIMGAS